MILLKSEENTVEKVSEVLKKGGTCVLPCDTIYGLSAIVPDGEKKLKDLKERDANKPFIVLATMEMAEKLCVSIPEKIIKCWPAPLTVILNTKDGKTTGIRVPDDPFLISVLEKTGSPIYSTSVNISGEPSLLDFTSIKNKFENRVDILVKSQEIQGTTASTIVDATGEEFKVIRQGAYIFN